MQNEDREKIYCTKNNDTEEKQKAIFGAMRGGRKEFKNEMEKKEKIPFLIAQLELEDLILPGRDSLVRCADWPLSIWHWTYALAVDETCVILYLSLMHSS